MAIISLDHAKDHLRVTSFDDDLDITRKIDQASYIVFDYLKSRAHVTGTIESSSVANPTVITMTAAHTFINGQTAIIAGHADSTPALNGSHVISNVTDTTFTVPVDVTVASTGGTVTVEWDEDTVPKPVQTAALLMLTHLWEHRGDGGNAGSSQQPDENIWRAMELFLARHRDPALA